MTKTPSSSRVARYRRRVTVRCDWTAPRGASVWWCGPPSPWRGHARCMRSLRFVSFCATSWRTCGWPRTRRCSYGLPALEGQPERHDLGDLRRRHGNLEADAYGLLVLRLHKAGECVGACQPGERLGDVMRFRKLPGPDRVGIHRLRSE